MMWSIRACGVMGVLGVMGRAYGACGVFREPNVACFVCVCMCVMVAGSMLCVHGW